MKKQVKKLNLRKETLLNLNADALLGAIGGVTGPSNCSDCGTTTTANCGGGTATSKTPSCNNLCTNEN